MSEYDKQLAAWKQKHGLDAATDQSLDELRMAAEDRASGATSWCLGCDKEMPVKEMKLITRRTDPYVQIDESEGEYVAEANRVRMCPACYKEAYEQPD